MLYDATRSSYTLRTAHMTWLASPRTRRISIARSASPSASISARLQSIIPAPVESRSAFTIAAVISGMSGTVHGLGHGLGRPLLGGSSRLVGLGDDLGLRDVRLEHGGRGDLGGLLGRAR